MDLRTVDEILDAIYQLSEDDQKIVTNHLLHEADSTQNHEETDILGIPRDFDSVDYVFELRRRVWAESNTHD